MAIIPADAVPSSYRPQPKTLEAMAALGLLPDQQKRAGDQFRRLNTRAFREGLAEVIEFSEKTHEPIILTRHGRDKAALVSMDDFELIEALRDISARGDHVRRLILRFAVDASVDPSFADMWNDVERLTPEMLVKGGSMGER